MPGENVGQIPLGQSEIWVYAGQSGETLSIEIKTRIGLLAEVTIRDQDNNVILRDDGNAHGGTNDLNLEVVLPVDGVYVIEISGYFDGTGGPYTLILGD